MNLFKKHLKISKNKTSKTSNLHKFINRILLSQNIISEQKSEIPFRIPIKLFYLMPTQHNRSTCKVNPGELLFQVSSVKNN